MMIVQFQPPATCSPYSLEVVGNYVARGGNNATSEFETALDLIPDGLERLRDLHAAADS
jgi:hypothetical protein